MALFNLLSCRRLTALLGAMAFGLTACSESPSPIPQLTIDQDRIAVAGMSSGAYMAHQMHLAYSDRLIGAALFSGGPYGCARGDLNIALGGCMNPPDAAMPDLDSLANAVRERSADGRLAPLSGLAGDRLYIWHGKQDQVVSERISSASAALYRSLTAEVKVSEAYDSDAAHVFPTEAAGVACGGAESPYIGACGFDGAGAAIRHLYQPEQNLDPPVTAQGTLREFGAEVPNGADVPGDSRGLIYLPQQCEQGKTCGLLIVLHGCEQSLGKIGDRFARDAGFNRWADALDLVVLYPQAQSSLMPLNPKACWDWWGYTGPDYDTRQGAQMQWIAAMSRALGAPLDD
ncbi:extracellular catalytic domain type 2 short-chain-length polyhydroxyalkanoate depolymerase [Pseudomarimonas arenosa]|uniref:Poly(3-hydroxybutyrate) depolymerase n=1 Tax=Pseudomarimonas arenosa TaxID=2774145 RepID=A0AAW3ZPF1_9GAMM|nr:PHB depolymerase family esterase [Pseudomarimonas arenosa]MBD8526514.1 hypothetical protein [Pseudomarimonas arenosa]